ncbi:dicarboxylate/amino acid:cation symporter [Sphingomonas sp. AP4-R1]|uniref:dicarboxylate/amino acid:cation symporter n=1 Tax=Sphingomonas sp. AP4-R1 TaxID=2735134 RepID=UPI0014932D22|nr:dicarboxylate/amino acid:cation symporter [Sphingomonas sp. AP4-R1]QJU58608.1 dicarboxylate/amino acid:cation symporter [Sphingomonas sp. AP4-R1]
MARRLTLFILLAMLVGILTGFVLNQTVSDPAHLATITTGFSILTDIFLRLIKMIIAPLIFGTLVAGIAHMGDSSALGRIGARSVGWFVLASLVSLSLGLVFVNLFHPGVGLGLPLPPVNEASGIAKPEFSLHDFFVHLVPTSIIDAMAKNDVLPIVIFSVFFGIAITAVGDKAKPIVQGLESLVHVMLQVTDYVMKAAPIAVFAAVANAVAHQGIAILVTYGWFMGGFFLALLVLWSFFYAVSYALIGRQTHVLIRYVREPFMIAFSTASSEAAFPRLLEALDKFGVPKRIASFVLPLGYSFNLDGSMMYCSFATMFIAQAYGIHISFPQQIIMMLLLMVTSKGIASVPRASLVVIASTLAFFDIPEAGLLLILAVDHFLDMGRTATNVLGNAVATVLVTKWEGAFETIESDEMEPLPTPAHTMHGGKAGLDLDPNR